MLGDLSRAVNWKEQYLTAHTFGHPCKTQQMLLSTVASQRKTFRISFDEDLMRFEPSKSRQLDKRTSTCLVAWVGRADLARDFGLSPPAGISWSHLSTY